MPEGFGRRYNATLYRRIPGDTPVTRAAIDAIVETVITACPDTQAIYRYGSWGTDYQRADSDLDVAVLLPHETAVDIDIRQWAALNGELAVAAHTEYVDLINLRTADTTLQAEILRTGEVVYSRDDDRRLDFEALVLSMHQKLNEARAPLYQDIMERGRVLAP